MKILLIGINGTTVLFRDSYIQSESTEISDAKVCKSPITKLTTRVLAIYCDNFNESKIVDCNVNYKNFKYKKFKIGLANF
jgi:hypothetical protein